METSMVTAWLLLLSTTSCTSWVLPYKLYSSDCMWKPYAAGQRSTYDCNGCNELMFSACRGNETAVKQLLSDPTLNINAQNDHGLTALILAAANSNNEIIKHLLERDDINIDTSSGYYSTNEPEGTAFFWAAVNGNERGVEMFLPRSNINEQTINQYDEDANVTILMAAVRSGNVNLVRFLLENGAATNLVDGSEQTALIIAAKGNNKKIVELLVPVSDAKATTRDGYTALMAASNGGNEEIFKLLLPLSHAKATTEDGKTALMEAAKGGNEEIVKFLLPASDAKAINNYGYTALMGAVKSGNQEIVKLLLPVSDVNATDNDKKTVLTVIIDRPINNKATPGYGCSDCTCEQSKIVQLLLAHPNIIVTDLDIQNVESSGCDNIVQLFKQLN